MYSSILILILILHKPSSSPALTLSIHRRKVQSSNPNPLSKSLSLSLSLGLGPAFSAITHRDQLALRSDVKLGVLSTNPSESNLPYKPTYTVTISSQRYVRLCLCPCLCMSMSICICPCLLKISSSTSTSIPPVVAIPAGPTVRVPESISDAWYLIPLTRSRTYAYAYDQPWPAANPLFKISYNILLFSFFLLLLLQITVSSDSESERRTQEGIQATSAIYNLYICTRIYPFPQYQPDVFFYSIFSSTTTDLQRATSRGVPAVPS